MPSLVLKFEESMSLLIQAGGHVEQLLEHVFNALIKKDASLSIEKLYQKFLQTHTQLQNLLEKLPTESPLTKTQSRKFLCMVRLMDHLEKMAGHLLNISRRLEDVTKTSVPLLMNRLPYLKKEMRHILAAILDSCHQDQGAHIEFLQARLKKLGELQGSLLIERMISDGKTESMTPVLFIERNFDKIGTHMMEMAGLLCDAQER